MASDPNKAPNEAQNDEGDIWDGEEPPRIRFLRRLVTVLGMVLIFGFILVVTAIVVKLTRPSGAGGPARTTVLGAETAAIPEDLRIESVFALQNSLMVLTRDAEDQAMLLEINPADGAVRAQMAFTAPPPAEAVGDPAQ